MWVLWARPHTHWLSEWELGYISHVWNGSLYVSPIFYFSFNAFSLSDIFKTIIVSTHIKVLIFYVLL